MVRIAVEISFIIMLPVKINGL